MRWIRWNYVLPRLSLVVIAVLTVELSAGMVARRLLVALGERTVGAQIDVASARASVLWGRVALEGIQVANPRRPLENLVAADCIELDLETGPLLHRRAIASSGVVRGLRFGTARRTSGALSISDESADDVPLAWLGDQAADAARQWFESLGEKFQHDLVEQLESVRLAEELGEKWPKKYAELEVRAKQLKSEASELQENVKTAQANPLRNVALLEQLPKQIAQLDESLEKLSAEIKGLPGAVATDRERLLAAREHDEQLIRDTLHVDAIDSAALSAYFVREQVAGPLGEVIDWIRWMRQAVGDKLDPPQPIRRRGTDVQFAGCQRQPDLLVRRLQLQGTARIGGQPIEMAGTLTDLTSHPAIHGRPVELRLTATGSLPLHLEATIDRTGPVPHDAVRLDCRGLLLPTLQLGRADKLGMSLAPSTGVVTASLMLDGDQLTGECQLVQNDVRITPIVGPELARWQLDAALEKSLDDLQSLETRVTLGGSLDRPELELSSNLGPAVSDAVGTALQQAAQAQSQQLATASREVVQKQLTQLDQLIQQRSAALLKEIEAPNSELAELAKTLSPGRISLEGFSGRLPKNSLFR